MNYDIDEYRRKRKQMIDSESLGQKVLRKWGEFYLQWEIYTLTYLFEPWEKWIINGVIFGILALLGFSSYVYLPGYTRKLINAFLPAPGSDHQHHHHLHLDQHQPMDFSVN